MNLKTGVGIYHRNKKYGTNHPQLKRPTHVTRTQQIQKLAWHGSKRVACNTRV